MSRVAQLIIHTKPNKTTTPKKPGSGASHTSSTHSGGVTRTVTYDAHGNITHVGISTNDDYKSPKDTYIGYLNDMGLGYTMTAAQMSKAAEWGMKNHLDSTGFETYLAKSFTAQYAASTRGQQDVANFRTRWTAYFGDTKPAKADYYKWLKTGGMASNQIDQFLQGTKQFQEQYVARGWGKNTAADLQRNPQDFQTYYQDFKDTMASYGETLDNNHAKIAFGAHLTPEQIKANMQTVEQGKQNFQQMYGQPMTGDQFNAAALNAGAGSENVRSQIANAFQLANTMDNSQVTKFGSERNTKGTITEDNTFGNVAV